MSGISILIPARNESKTIARTLRSVVEQIPARDEYEVIVCDNGSTDDTPQQIAQLARQDAHIRLICEPKAGKTHAWNRLFHEARFDVAVFMDADVIPAKDVFERLKSALSTDPNLVLAGAYSAPYRKSLRWRHRLVAAITQPNRHQSWIVGRLYAIRRHKFLQRMRQYGMEEMPEICAAEDTWVSLVAGRGHWRIIPEAIVYHTPYTFSEFIRIERRHLLSLETLRQQCPQLVKQAGFERKPRELLAQKLLEILKTKGLTAKICTLLRLPVVGLVRRRVHHELRRGTAAPFKWEVSEASKDLPAGMD
jgi:glycosyltransferase involved in cell wall biosynthesis